ncbi:hypothetical protein AXF42_Ash001605 [Apostasia shenzhenica]|uniref:Uncharacterized protein n=1 Tax=Apostasia shenzhenica TaxID=1088818 RepID=A0A2I0AAQ4_9ASPA|nr:hypothetical protein AXF42_Ash001605 [Apostasia shenzhenica]
MASSATYTLDSIKPAVLLFFIITVGATNGNDGGWPTIHELLVEYGLPAGILPKAVESYWMDRSTGLPEVRLDRPCYAKYDGPPFFDREVRGNLSYGELRCVVGLRQEELFLWLPVHGILASNPSFGVILFDIGLARKRLSLSLFEIPPDCRPEETARAPHQA